MPDNLLIPLPSIVLSLCMIIGGLFVFRRAYVKQLGELQERIISTYKAQNEALEKDLANLRHEITAMRLAFKQLGLEIEINGTTITIIDGQQAKRKRIIQVPTIEDEMH